MPTNDKKLTSTEALKIINKFIERSLQESEKETGKRDYPYVTGMLSVITASLLAGESSPTLNEFIKQEETGYDPR